jgi:hypothetical protein
VAIIYVMVLAVTSPLWISGELPASRRSAFVLNMVSPPASLCRAAQT